MTSTDTSRVLTKILQHTKPDETSQYLIKKLIINVNNINARFINQKIISTQNNSLTMLTTTVLLQVRSRLQHFKEKCI